MLDKCVMCGKTFSDEYGIECGCEPDEPTYYDDED
jgi:hypothetical protein